MHFHRQNMMVCEIVTGRIWTPLIGAYLPPLMLYHLPDFEEFLQRFKGLDLIVLGDLNVELEDVSSSRIQRVADLLMEFDLNNLAWQFLYRRRFWDLKTWTQVQQGTVLGLICNYILNMDQHLFELVRIQNTQNYASNHFVLRARLLQGPTQFHAHNSRGGEYPLSQFPPPQKSAGLIPNSRPSRPWIQPPPLKRPPLPL